MATVNLGQLNQYVKNYYDQIGLPDLEAHHAERIRDWFKENLSLIGTYGHRDHARFGNFKSANEDNDHFGRADGWVSLSEEVPDVDHLTYGTGILYIHGEMEIPDNEKSSLHPQTKDHIFGDEFYHVDKDGNTKHIYDDADDPDRYIDWDEASTELRQTYHPLLQATEIPPGTNRGDVNEYVGFVWENKTETHTGTEGDDKWLYQSITDAAGGIFLEEVLGAPSSSGTTPSVFFDSDVYNIDNDRHHFPWIIVNSGAPVSIKKFLEKYWEGQNGMYDSDLPALAKDTYPPKKHGGIKYVKDGVDGIVDYISPIEEAPE